MRILVSLIGGLGIICSLQAQQADRHGWLNTETLKTPFGDFEFKNGYPAGDTAQRLLDLHQLVIAGPSWSRDRHLDMICGLAAVEPPGGGQYHQRSGDRGGPLPCTRVVGCQRSGGRGNPLPRTWAVGCQRSGDRGDPPPRTGAVGCQRTGDRGDPLPRM